MTVRLLHSAVTVVAEVNLMFDADKATAWKRAEFIVMRLIQEGKIPGKVMRGGVPVELPHPADV